MTTLYPGALDAFTNPASGDAMNSATVPHAAQHANANDAIEALQAKLGDDSTPAELPAGASLGKLKARVFWWKAPSDGAILRVQSSRLLLDLIAQS